MLAKNMKTENTKMHSSTTQNYLKAIYTALQNEPKKVVSMGYLSKVMQITPGTTTTMMKTLDKLGLVKYQPRSGVSLTKLGQQMALKTIRKHRIIELFLVDVLGMNWVQVHQEAEILEHWVSSRVLNKMEKLLGFPTVDPHGDPIPNSQGEIANPQHKSLHECEIGRWQAVARILDQDTDFLRFAEKKKFLPGQKVKVIYRDLQADVTDLAQADDTRFSIGTTVAKKILVEAVQEKPAFKTNPTIKISHLN